MGRIAGLALVALAALLGSGGTALAAPVWLPPEASFGATDGELSTATMTPDGTVVSVRLAPVAPGEYELQARTRPPGGTFGPTEPIDRPVSSAIAPSLVSGRDGTVAVVYVRNGGSTRASFRAPGGSFDPPRLLSASGAGVKPEQLGFDNAGRLWFAHQQGAAIIASALGPSGSAVDLLVETAPPGAAPFPPALSISPAGEVRVAYEFTAATSCGRSWELRESDGGIGGFPAHALLDTATGCPMGGNAMGPAQLASTGDGATVVVYSLGPYESPTATVLARYRPPGGAWPPPASAAETIGNAVNPIASVLGGGATPLAIVASMGSPTSLALSSRAPGGSWTLPQVVTGAAGGSLPRLATAPGGAGIVAWKQAQSPYRMMAVTRSPAGALSPPAFVSGAEDFFASLGGAGVDDEGNAVLGWSTHLGVDSAAGYRALVAGYDGAGPRFTSLTVPADGLAGEPLGFAATATDVWSAVGPPSWQFGDGGGASGSAVSHSFGPGSYDVSVAVTDAVGNTTSANRSLRVAAVPSQGEPVGPARDTTPPTLTKVRLKPKKVKRGKAARLSFALSEAATVRVVVARGAKGTKRRGKCVKPQPKARGKAKPCRRFVTVRSLAGEFGAGGGSLALPKTLKVGGYRVTAVATDAAGNASPPASAQLKVVPRKQKPKPKQRHQHPDR